MKHLILILVCMTIFFRLSSAALDTGVLSKNDKGNITFALTQHFTVNASSKNNNAVTSDTRVEQTSNAVSGPSEEKVYAEYLRCRDRYDREFIACMHRHPRELYQKILLTIHDEEVEYYYDQLKFPQLRAEIKSKKFTQEEWEALAVAKPEFTAKVDELVRILKK